MTQLAKQDCSKYGGLEWFDINSNKMYLSDKDQLIWGGR